MPSRVLAIAMVLAIPSALGACAGAPCDCAVDEERIARRVAELVIEREAELAEETSGAEGEPDDDDDDDASGLAGAPGPSGPHGPRPGPAPGAPPVAAVPFSDPAPAGPAVAVAPRPVARPSPAGPEPRVWIAPGRSPSRGPAGALVTMITFTDFECPFCSRAAQTVEELRGRYPDELRVVFKQFPLAIHHRAIPAAEAAIEAFVQGGNDAFWRMHDLLFANTRALSIEDLVRYASELGLDEGRLAAAVEADVHRPAVEADISLGRASGVTGTPTFFLNGTRLVGARPIDAFAAAVEAELVVARAELARGTPRSRIYETIANGAPRRPRGAR